MSKFIIKKGLDIPIVGKAAPVLEKAAAVSTVGVMALDYKGLKPRVVVAEGAKVDIGSPLFTDKVTGVIFASPGSGEVLAIHRGEKRRLHSIEIKLTETEKAAVTYPATPVGELRTRSAQAIRQQLNETGCWTALRERPFSRIPSLTGTPQAIFVTAMDTAPLGSYPARIIALHREAFVHGLRVLERLTDNYVHVCLAPATDIPHVPSERIVQHVFSGKHPAGLVGTHIHFIEPITRGDKKVWHIGYQDVIRIGHLFLTGTMFNERYVALGGPQVNHPRILKTRLGANLTELTAQEVKTGANRVISGAPIAGRKSEAGLHFLGAYDNSVAVLLEDRGRHFQEFMLPGGDKFSLKAVFLSKLFKNKEFAMGTSRHGSLRAVVPIGAYEEVLPLNILATPLIKAILAQDLESAEQLGILELAPEDLALCTFVCPGKNNISDALEEALEMLASQ